MRTYKRRDLSITDLYNGQSLVIANDSCGGIGQKPADRLNCTPYTVGRFTARVALMEVLTSGAMVVTLANAVCNEMEPTAREVIRGINDEMISAGIGEEALNGSTEDNFETAMTAVGVTVVGLCVTDKLAFKPCYIGDTVILMGKPMVGDQVLSAKPGELVTYEDINKLLDHEGTKEIVPVGSKGIRYEAELLASLHGLNFEAMCDTGIDLDVSAGPATCAIAAISPKYLPLYSNCVKIGELA